MAIKTKKRSTPHPLVLMERMAINAVEMMLFEGSAFGGQSLQQLLEVYKEDGPYTPIRYDLVQHLIRCHEVLVEMDAVIRARARTLPTHRVRLPKKKGTTKK